ncbi:hypothetical protein [Saccharothrix obliqua]|uniref:hypothetical protein n=1 Tax=Saccharothrix obliqua TaxID=2861747 RepID=UPI001C603B8D|nr:hypothetical protein [Saccharothrix obliqua]MBW4722404.1 hypothetical protein [Saccharothrix obliqua]
MNTTIVPPAGHRAAAALYATLVGLYLSDQDDAARYLLGRLDPDLVAQLNALADRDIDRGLANAVRAASATDTAGNPAPHAAAGEPTWEQRTRDALRRVLTGITPETVTGSAAYGALVHRVREACDRDDVDPAEVLTRLGTGRLAIAARVDDPAAYLAAKIRDWHPDDPDNA